MFDCLRSSQTQALYRIADSFTSSPTFGHVLAVDWLKVVLDEPLAMIVYQHYGGCVDDVFQCRLGQSRTEARLISLLSSRPFASISNAYVRLLS